MYGKGLRPLSIATVAMLAVALSLVFFYAPLDADQGFVQKIFYLHVPLAIIALVGFVVGGFFAIPHLRSGDRRWDAYSYVSIHMSVIFGVAVLLTGSIWAKASWGHWWVWDEPTLVSFLIVFLMYATYYPLPLRDRGPRAPGALRLGLRDHRRRLRAAQLHRRAARPEPRPPARLRDDQRRPARLDDADLPRLPGGDRAALGDPGQVRADREERLRPAEAAAPRARRAGPGGALPRRPGGELDARPARRRPALPLDEAGKYVAGAYVVFVVLLVVYVAIMAAKLQRIERELRELAELCGDPSRRARREPPRSARRSTPMSELLALGVSHKTAPLDLRERLSLTEGRAVGALRELTERAGNPRGGGDLDLQPHRALPGRLRPGRGGVDGARRPHPPGRDPPDRAARPPLLAALRRGRPPPLRVTAGPRLDDRRRGRDPGPGQTRLRAGAGRGRAPGRSSTASSAAPSPPAGGPATRPGSARRASRSPRSRSSSPGARSATSPTAACWSSAPARPPSWSPGRWSPAASPPSSSPTATTTARSASHSASAASAVRFEELPEQLEQADIVVSATNSPHHIVERDELAAGDGDAATGGRCCWSTSPCRATSSPACREIAGVSLHDIDDVQQIVERNASGREAEAQRAELIIEAELDRFERWLASLEVVPTIAALRERGDEVVRRVLAENDPRWESLSEADRERVEAMAKAIASRLLHEPTLRMKPRGRQRRRLPLRERPARAVRARRRRDRAGGRGAAAT